MYLHFIPLAIDGFGILLEVSAIDDFKTVLGITVVFGGRCDERGRGVDAVNFRYGRGEIDGEFAVTAPHVEDAICGLRVEVLEDFLSEFRDE